MYSVCLSTLWFKFNNCFCLLYALSVSFVFRNELTKESLCGHIKARWDSHDTCLACTGCTLLKKCAVCELWSYDIWTQAGRRRMSNSRKRHEPLTDVDDPVTSLVTDDQLTFQSPDTGHDGGVVCRSSSDRMTLIVDLRIDQCLTKWQPPFYGLWPVT